MSTTFYVKNRIIKLFLKFIDFEKKFDIQESNKRERKQQTMPSKKNMMKKEIEKKFDETYGYLIS